MNFRASDLQQFKFSLLTELVDAAHRLILPDIPSKTIRDNLQRRVDDRTLKGGLFVRGLLPLIIHDGRRGFGPKHAHFLVWFVDRSDDPRRDSRDPLDLIPERRLTQDEFRMGLAENRRRYQLDPSGGPMQFMVVWKRPDGSPAMVGPSEPKPFFEHRGHQAFVEAADDIAHKVLDDFVTRHLIQETVPVRIVL